MNCTGLAHMTDDQLIHLIILYTNQVQSTIEQLKKNNEIFECVSDSTYRLKRTKYITDLFFKSSEMYNSGHMHKKLLWNSWKYKPSDEDMMSQICDFCNDMRIKLESINTTLKDNDIKNLFVKTKRLQEVLYKDRHLFIMESSRPSSNKKRKLEENN